MDKSKLSKRSIAMRKSWRRRKKYSRQSLKGIGGVHVTTDMLPQVEMAMHLLRQAKGFVDKANKIILDCARIVGRK